MKYSGHPADGFAFTLDDLEKFVGEMKGYRNLPGDTQVRAMGRMEIDVEHGPRIVRLTAGPEDGQARMPRVIPSTR